MPRRRPQMAAFYLSRYDICERATSRRTPRSDGVVRSSDNLKSEGAPRRDQVDNDLFRLAAHDLPAVLRTAREHRAAALSARLGTLLRVPVGRQGNAGQLGWAVDRIRQPMQGVV